MSTTPQKPRSLDCDVVDDEDMEKSPYADTEIITLTTKSSSSFLIHRSILSQALSTSDPITNSTLTLPNLDNATAHTLVHYLYTRAYQSVPADPADSASKYTHLTSLYTLSTTTLPLPPLASLVRQTIHHLTPSLSIYSILSTARDTAFPHLSTTESWYPDHVESAIKDAALKDPGLFTKPEFTDQIEGDKRFRQCVMKAVLETCQAEKGSISSASVADSQSVDVGEDVSVSASTPTTGTGTGMVQRKQSYTPSLTLPEIEPTVSANAPEPFTDELGFEKTKTWQSQTHNTNSVNNTASVPAVDVIGKLGHGHARADSVVQSEASLSLSSPTQETGSVEKEKSDGLVNGNAGVAKKNKKIKKKKTTATN